MRRLIVLLLTGTSLALARQSPPLPAGFSVPNGYGDGIYPQLGDAGLDVTHYDLSVTSDPRQDTISGRTVLSVTALRNLSQISLDFAGPKVLGVKLGNQAVQHVQVGEKLLILPPALIASGTAFTLTVAYSGTPALHFDSSTGGGLRLGWITQAGGSYVLSEPDGAHTFFPCNDVPADGASYSLHLDVPAGYTAVASGIQTRQVTVSGRTRSDFVLTQPIPSYALTVHVGKLELETQPGPAGIQIRNAYPVGLPENVKASFAQTPAMIGLLADWFGPYPYPVYGVAVSADPQIPALETATLSTFPARLESPTTALHELSHQWFGNSLRLGDWSDIWLNEGFATYAELLWAQGQGQKSGALLENWYTRLARAPARGLVATQSKQLFDTSSYLRGALALHALRMSVGDGRFRRILTDYVSRFTGKSVRTADFLGVVENIGGQTALEAMQPWLVGPALPPFPKDVFIKTVRQVTLGLRP